MKKKLFAIPAIIGSLVVGGVNASDRIDNPILTSCGVGALDIADKHSGVRSYQCRGFNRAGIVNKQAGVFYNKDGQVISAYFDDRANGNCVVEDQKKKLEEVDEKVVRDFCSSQGQLMVIPLP